MLASRPRCVSGGVFGTRAAWLRLALPLKLVLTLSAALLVRPATGAEACLRA